MAITVVNFPLGFVDTDVPDIIAALQYKFGMPTGTNQQVIDALRAEFAKQVKALVKESKIAQAQATIAAVQGGADITITFP